MKWFLGKPKEKCQLEAQNAYQVSEFHGQLWLTYNGVLICPTDMFSDEPLKALSKIRDLYVERNSTEQP